LFLVLRRLGMTLLEHVEAAAARVSIALVAALPAAVASDVGGALARCIGPLLPVSGVAHANLRAAMPELDAAARRRIVRGVWESLGRTAAEFPHVGRLPHNSPSGPGWEVQGEDIVADLAARGGPAIFFSGHIANWEILPRAAAFYGVTAAALYRAAQNQAVDELMRSVREDAAGQKLLYFQKGSKGARQTLQHLARGGIVAALIDQKMNDGIEARLFGLPAMTASAAASLALHFRCPLVPALSRRIGPARLRLIVEPPLTLPDSGNRAADVLSLTQAMNDVLERWIREQPESWLWLHRRWPKSVVAVSPGK
jgi:KDO2-lipid IV(A) lauroyltransferase